MRTTLLAKAGLVIAVSGLLGFPGSGQADVIEAGTSANLTVRARADDGTTRRIQAQPLIGNARPAATPNAANGLPPRDDRNPGTIVRTRQAVEPVVVRSQTPESDRSEPTPDTSRQAANTPATPAGATSSSSQTASEGSRSSDSHIFVSVPVEQASQATNSVQVSTAGRTTDTPGVFSSADDPGQTISQAALDMFAPQASDPNRYEIDHTQANQLAGGGRYVTVISHPSFVHSGPVIVQRAPARTRTVGTLYFHPQYGYVNDFRPVYVTTQSGIVTSNAHFVTTRTVAYPPVIFHHRPVVRHRPAYVCYPVHRPVIIRHHRPCGTRVGISHRSSNFGLSVNLRF